MQDIQKRQEDILTYIEDCTAEHQCPPTIREIQAECGIASTSTVHSDLKDLEETGFIKHIGMRYAPVYTERYINKIGKAIEMLAKGTIN